jgi:hypothetical protein
MISDGIFIVGGKPCMYDTKSKGHRNVSEELYVLMFVV